MKTSKLYNLIQSIKHPITTYNRFIDCALKYDKAKVKKYKYYQKLALFVYGNKYKNTIEYSILKLKLKIYSLEIEFLKSIRICNERN